MATADTPAGSGGLDVQDVFEIVQRRWLWLAQGAVGGLILGLAVWLVLPPEYEASTSILVEPQGVPESYVRSTVTLRVEQRIGTLHQRVTSHANLNELIDQVGAERLDPSGEGTREDLMNEIRDNLNFLVRTSSDSRKDPGGGAVVTLRYTGGDPEIVASMVREIANQFIAENHRDRAQQAASTAEFLEGELDRIRADVSEAERRIREFRMERMGGLPSQLEANLRGLDRLDESLVANLDAQERIERELGLLRGRRGEGRGTDSLGSALSRAREELTVARSIYTEDHPKVLSLRGQIEQLERVIQDESTELDTEWIDPMLQREIEAAQINLNSRKNEERHLRERIETLQAHVEAAPKNEQEMLELSRDYETLRQTYTLMLGNKHDAALVRNLENAQMAEQFTLLRPARIPDAPFWPDPFTIVPIGLAAGLGFAALLVLWFELRTPAFHSVDTLARRLGLPIFAAIPELVREKIYDGVQVPSDRDWRLVVPGAPNSAAAEQYRGFAPHFLSMENCRVILVTSAQPEDGKTLTTVNLAFSLASDVGRSVLLIDADIRRASVHRLTKTPREPGLTDVLLERAELSRCVQNIGPNLTVLTAGTAVSNPIALLTNESFLKLCEQASENYEVVMIDSPPILPVVDAMILRRVADMVIFVVRAGISPSGGVIRAMRELKGVAGVVFNRVSPSAFRRYYYYDAYSQYEYRDRDRPD